MIERQTYIDVRHTAPDFARHGFDIVQPKHDGQWCTVTVRDHTATITGRNGTTLAL